MGNSLRSPSPSTNSTISGNYAGSGRAAACITSGGTVTVPTAPSRVIPLAANGGGVANYNGGTITLLNSTIAGNAAEYNVGGGVHNASAASPWLVH